jgi:hypothetical protein
MAYIIKTLLPITNTLFYENVKDNNKERVAATRIVFCNTSASPVDIYLSVYNPDLSETFQTGAILFNYALAGNAFLELATERDLYPNDELSAYADTADVVSMSIDIIGDDGRYVTAV